MGGPLDVPVIIAIFVCLIVLLGPKTLKELAADFQEALQHFSRGDLKPRPELRGVEWLGLALTVLFLELIWVVNLR
jgi:hypothetical protein